MASEVLRASRVQFLPDTGADMEFQDRNGQTGLILAATRGYRDMVELLLKRGANPMLSDKGGRTALYWALANGHKEIAEILNSRVKEQKSDATKSNPNFLIAPLRTT